MLPKSPIWHYSDISTTAGQSSFFTQLLEHGWAYVDVGLDEMEFANRDAIFIWKEKIESAFLLNNEQKHVAGNFRGERGVTIGYRQDDNREFIETRTTKFGQIIPQFDDIPTYQETIRTVFSLYYQISRAILRCIATHLNVEESYLFNMTDIPAEGTSQSPALNWKVLPIDEDEFSSSLLRICRYPGHVSAITPTDQSDPSISFGSHTDTSFITMGIIGNISGMEIWDQKWNTWVPVESNDYLQCCWGDIEGSAGGTLRLVVFTGEFLQIVSGHKFCAAVHRVRTPTDQSQIRISCPFLVRGRDRACVGPVPYRVASAEEESRQELPDLSGTTMKLLHKLLDFKRSKCMKLNATNEEDWVLKAF